ncbi:tyrosine-protein phosphatase [Paenibacillus protaetiae]|uniref:Tyrosine-protein phosphatase n=1 Tax=Paenibacillus protaetiae TaxID=2509456 RepID=A0A4P6EXC4_9BACL|nr:CpsB/CapC family capsule biosynthesis tyrosine phosphatase [Paenibacillus protaetiae]QAY67714.1 protein tyrosine phosphatase [Paenibacillus protaetiae]
MIEIHTHILPGIDDGAADWDMALQLAQSAAAQGITDIIATPHHRNSSHYNPAQSVVTLTEQLNERLAAAGIAVTVHPGQEVHLHRELLDHWQKGELLTLANGPYMLLEMPHSRVPEYMESIVYELGIAGIRAVIPHPERNAEVARHPDKLEQLVELGALAQVTSASLLGGYGKGIERLSWSLCKKGFIHLISSDAHHPVRRGIQLAEAYEQAERQLGAEWSGYYRDNAAAVLAGKPIDAEFRPALQKASGWQRIRGLFTS